MAPSGYNDAVWTFVGRSEAVEGRNDIRAEDDMPESWLCRIRQYPPEALIEPCTNLPKHDMVH